MKMVFIGGGNMGEAMVHAVLEKGMAKADEITVSDVSGTRRSHLAKRYGVNTESDNRTTVGKADIVVIAVKPASLPVVSAELKGLFQSTQTVVSIVAGAPLSLLYERLGHTGVVRCMPNMPAQVGEGMTVWIAAEGVDEEGKKTVASLLGSLGREIRVEDEKLIDMATAVSGSGPGFVFLIIESLIDAGVQIGLPRDLSQELVLETILGSTRMVRQSGKHPAELRNQVTSPGGTTAEGLLRLESGGIRALIAQAVIAAYDKARALTGG